MSDAGSGSGSIRNPGNCSPNLILSDVEGHYYDVRTKKYYRLSSASNMIPGVPTLQDVAHAKQQQQRANVIRSLKERRDWRDKLPWPKVRRRLRLCSANLAFGGMIGNIPHNRMDSIIMNGYFNDSHWRRFAADRKAKHDIRMKVDIGNFHYATHMATCIQGGSPTVLMTLRKQHSDNNYIGVLHVQTDDTQDNNRQLKVSSPGAMLQTFCPGKIEAFCVCSAANMEITLDGTGICAYAGIVPSAETGSKIARCAFDNKGQLVHMETVRLRSTVKSMAVGPSFGEVVIGSENSVMLFNYERKKGVQFIPSKPPVLAVTCKANGNEIFAGAGKYGINVFDIREYGGRPTYFLPGSFCCSMQLLGNGRSIITSHFGGDLLAYDLRMRKAVDAYRGHVNPVYWMLPLLLDDRKETVASAGSDGVIRTWSVRTAELLMSFNPPYTVLNPWHVPRFVYSDTWCGTAKNPTLLATWLNTLELSQMRRPMEMCLLGNMEDTDISTTKFTSGNHIDLPTNPYALSSCRKYHNMTVQTFC